MAKYRVELDVAFNTEEDAIAFLNLAEEIKDKIYKGTEYKASVMAGEEIIEAEVKGDGIPVIKKCRYHKCFHDENPPKQCGNYVNVNFDDEKPTEHKASDGKVYKTTTFIATDKEK